MTDFARFVKAQAGTPRTGPKLAPKLTTAARTSTDANNFCSTRSFPSFPVCIGRRAPAASWENYGALPLPPARRFCVAAALQASTNDGTICSVVGTPLESPRNA